MKRISLSGLSVLIALFAFLGYSPGARADYPLGYESWADVPVDPANGTVVTDISQLQTITYSLPEGTTAYFTKSISYKAYLVKAGETTDIVSGGKYTSTISSDKTVLTLTRSDLANLEPGDYELYATGSGTFAVKQSGGSTALNCPKGALCKFTYNPGGGSSLPFTPSIAKGGFVSSEEFANYGIKLTCENNFVLMNYDVAPDAYFTCDGQKVDSYTGYNLIKANGTCSGVTEFYAPAGLFYCTVDGTKYESPEMTTYFYVGELTAETNPVNGGSIVYDTLIKSGFTLAYPEGWTVAPVKDVYKGKAYLMYGTEKLLGDYGLTTTTTTPLVWEVAEALATRQSDDVPVTVFFPEGTYNLTYDGKTFKSPEINFSFTVTPPVAAAVITGATVPANGAVVEGNTLNTFSINFACEESAVTSFATSDNIRTGSVEIAYSADEGYSNGYGLTEVEGTPGTWTIDTPITVTEPTELTISVREGAYTVTLADGRTQDSPAFTSTFTLKPETQPEPVKPVVLSYTSTPANGATVAEADFADKKISLSFSGLDNLADLAIGSSENAELVVKHNGEDVTSQVTKGLGGNTYFKLNKFEDVTGEWNFVLNEGYYEFFDEDTNVVYGVSPAINLTFTIEGATPEPVVVNYTTTPADGATVNVNDFAGVTLAFADATAVTLQAGSFDEVTFKNGDTAYEPTLSRDNLTFNLPRNVETMIGTWTFALPEGFYGLTIDGKTVNSPAISITFTVSEDGGDEPGPTEPTEPTIPTIPAPFNLITLTPAADSTVTSASQFQEVILSLPGDGKGVEGSYYFSGVTPQAAFDRYITLRKVVGNGQYETIGTYVKGVKYGATDADKAKMNQYMIAFDGTVPALTNGTYQLVFDDQVIKLRDYKDNTSVQSGQFIYQYTVEISETPVEPDPVVINYTTTPAQDAEVDDLESFKVTFEGATAATINFDKLMSIGGANAVTLTCGSTTLVYGNDLVDNEDDPTMFELLNKLAPTEPTLATVKIAAGFYSLTVNGKTEDSPAVEFSFTVGKAAAPAADPTTSYEVYTVDPAAGEITDVTKLDNVTLTLPEGWTYSNVGSYTTNAMWLQKLNGTNWEDVVKYSRATRSQDKKSVVLTPLNPMNSLNLEAGTYRIYSPKAGGLMIFSGSGAAQKNPIGVVVEYTVNPSETPVDPNPPVEPGELTWTTSPEEGAQVDVLTEFSVNFANVRSYGWTSESTMPNVTLTYNGTTLNYLDDFNESSTLNVMVMEQPLTFETPTQVTAKFAAGLFTMVMNDGSEVVSPEVVFTFTVGKEYTGPERVAPESTVPADGSQVDTLSEFTVNFANVKEYGFLNDNVLPDITLTYGDKTLSYTEGFAESVMAINTMVLEDEIAPNKPTKVTVKFGEGIYKMTLNDDTEVTNQAFEFTFTVGKEAPIGNDAWVPLTDINQLDGAEVAFVWYYDGTPAGPASAPAKVADPITNKVQSCIVMNTTEDPTISGGKFYANDFCADQIDGDNYVAENGKLKAIRVMPETANIVKAHKTAEGYSFEFTNYTPSEALMQALDLNADGPYYMAPNLDLDSNRNSLQPADQPYYNSVSVSANGIARMRSTYRDDADQFSATTLWSFTGKSQAIFSYIKQILDLGDLYIMVKQTGDPKATITADPANQSTIEASNGTQEITFSVDGYDYAAVSKTVTPTAKFNGNDAAITFTDTYPVKATVTVPANTDGTLTISIPEGWMQVENGELVLNTSAYEYTLNFKEKLAVADVDVTITPADGSTVENIETITVTFPANVVDVVMNDNADFSVTLDGYPTNSPTMQGETIFRYRPAYTEAGTYCFKLGEGFYTLTMADGTKALSPEISTTVTVNPYGSGDNINYTTTPAKDSSVKELKEFGVTFEGVADTSFGFIEPTEAFSLSYDNTTLTYGTDFTEDYTYTKPITTMVLKEALTFDQPTVVTVKIAEGAYMLTLTDSSIVMSPAIEFSFTVGEDSGLSFIVGEGANNDVYTTDGIRILKDATKEQFNQLAPGLYIVGGKVVYKK